MCLITDNLEKQIATEDLIVYKLFKKNLYSFFMLFKYEIDVLYGTEIKKIHTNGFWSTCCDLDSNYLRDKYGYEWDKNPKLICLSEGFHSGLNADVVKHIYLHSNNNKVIPLSCEIYSCIIPKGAEYYTDAVGFVISNKIIIKDKILF